ncbi:unnamed protein product [Spirodela intermedia]|uniref:C2 domain-containing protein n=1 Tax=Spirodela intermedia TaxID=51605 RepID=A0A7I8KZS4_SPIIN|nr:unnamed protein product [Spirodela intermedia]
MASQYEVEVTVISGKNMKNVNWRNGNLHPYVVLWLDPAAKRSTKVAVDGEEGSGEDPLWDEKLTIPLPPGGSLSTGGAALSIDVVHANAGKDTKPLVGSAIVPLAEIVDEVGIGGKASRTLKLKRPSGRPQGKLEVKIAVREPSRYYDSPPPPAPGYGAYAPPAYGHQYRDYGGAPAPYGYGAPPPSGCPSYGYPYGAAPPPAVGYGQPSAYGQQPYAVAGGEKKSKFGMGTGLAVGAAAGVLGGLALAEGADYVEDKIADDVAERVEDDLGFDDDGGDF